MSFREEVKAELQVGLPKDPVHECVKILAGSSPDYERLRSGTGFSNKDALIGKQLAGLPSLGRNQFKHAQKLIKGYEDQLPPKLYLEALDAQWEKYYHEEATNKINVEEAEVDGIKFRIPFTVNRFGENVIDLHEFAIELQKKFYFTHLKDAKGKPIALVHYDPKNGIYLKDGEDRLGYTLEHTLGSKAPINFKNEMLRHIKDLGFQRYEHWSKTTEPRIAVRNGILNLNKCVNGDMSGCLEPFSPECHLFSKLGVDYDPNAPCDLLINHLNMVIPDESDRDRFHKIIGSFLETDAYGHQKILILYGKGGSGKTVTLRAFSKFFGLENISAKSFQQLTEDRFAIADLFGALANIIEELPQNAIKYLQKLNSLTGGLVDGQRKGRDPFTFYQNAKICAACNDLPEVNEDTQTILAFMSRLIIIVFDTQIRGTGKEIQNYDDVILSQKPGILNWVLDGYKKYVLDGKKITNSKSTDETYEYYIANSDFLQYFADGCFEKGDSEKDYVIKEDVWRAYVKAAKLKNVPTQSRQTVLEKFPTKTRWVITSDRISIGKKANGKPDQAHVFKGIKLKKETEWFTKPDNENEKNFEPSSDGGYGSQAGNHGKVGNELPQLPTLEGYGGQNKQGETGNQDGNPGNQNNQLPELPTQDPHPPSGESEKNNQTPEGINKDPEGKEEKKENNELDQKAKELFKSLKDKFEFFRPPEEHMVTREPDNVFRYLHKVEGLSEEESDAIISKWQELGLVEIVQNQIVLKDQAQERDQQ
jgi:P4 family phage/plasmid primase-like protien